MSNAWFILYHRYSRKTYFDREGIEAFQHDAAWAGRNGIKFLIIEDYFMNYPEYMNFWSFETLREFLKIAHDQGIKVLPYTSPNTMDMSSILYKIHGEEWTAKVDSVLGGKAISWAMFRSEPDGGVYWHDYRGETMNWVATCAATSWRDHYLSMVRGLLEFGFDGIYIDQHQEGTACVDHPNINEAALEMLQEMKRLVRADSPENVVIANVMSGHPDSCDPNFVERTKVADYGLTESGTADIQDSLKAWITRTGLKFFFFSHGTYESHLTKVEQAKKLGQPLCLFTPRRFADTDPRILKLYERP